LAVLFFLLWIFLLEIFDFWSVGYLIEWILFEWIRWSREGRRCRLRMVVFGC